MIGLSTTHATRALLALLLFWPGALRATETRAFWVWNRGAPLTVTEIAALRVGGVSRLYWHVGELVARPGGALAWKHRVPLPPAPEGLEIIPTVRLATELRSPELFTAGALAEKLAGAAVNGRVQVDYDCPDRLVPVYAERLRAVRATGGAVSWLSVTALAGWVNGPGFADLRAAADELCPMFYDLDPDPLTALLDRSETARRLADWRREAGDRRWLAGLPAFARVTFLGPARENQGHLRAWRWDDLFQPGLRAPNLTDPLGRTRFRADRPVRLGDREVPAGQWFVVRYPPESVVRSAIHAARLARASGVCFFRLPDPAGDVAADGPSLRATLGTLESPAHWPPMPRLRLRRETGGGTLVLENLGPDVDLPPRHEAYGLEVECGEAGQPVWREALPGDFFGVGVEPSGAGAAVGLARRVLFRFARLPAGGSLRTGLVQLAPGADPGLLRWRVRQIDPANPASLWQPVEAAFSSSPSP